MTLTDRVKPAGRVVSRRGVGERGTARIASVAMLATLLVAGCASQTASAPDKQQLLVTASDRALKLAMQEPFRHDGQMHLRCVYGDPAIARPVGITSSAIDILRRVQAQSASQSATLLAATTPSATGAPLPAGRPGGLIVPVSVVQCPPTWAYVLTLYEDAMAPEQPSAFPSVAADLQRPAPALGTMPAAVNAALARVSEGTSSLSGELQQLTPTYGPMLAQLSAAMRLSADEQQALVASGFGPGWVTTYRQAVNSALRALVPLENHARGRFAGTLPPGLLAALGPYRAALEDARRGQALFASIDGRLQLAERERRDQAWRSVQSVDPCASAGTQPVGGGPTEREACLAHLQSIAERNQVGHQIHGLMRQLVGSSAAGALASVTSLESHVVTFGLRACAPEPGRPSHYVCDFRHEIRYRDNELLPAMRSRGFGLDRTQAAFFRTPDGTWRLTLTLEQERQQAVAAAAADAEAKRRDEAFQERQQRFWRRQECLMSAGSSELRGFCYAF